MGHLFVPQFQHGRFDILLGNDEFFAKPVPVRLLGQIEELLAMPVHGLLDTKSFRTPKQFATKRRNIFGVLAHDCKESVTDKDAKTESESDSVVETERPRRSG